METGQLVLKPPVPSDPFRSETQNTLEVLKCSPEVQAENCTAGHDKDCKDKTLLLEANYPVLACAHAFGVSVSMISIVCKADVGSCVQSRDRSLFYVARSGIVCSGS